jgi:hypothetical protein
MGSDKTIFEVRDASDPHTPLGRFDNLDDAKLRADDICAIDQSEGKTIEVVRFVEKADGERTPAVTLHTCRG